MMKSLRKSANEPSAPRPAPKFQTLLAHRSNAMSCVTPRSSVMASNSVRPGDLRLVLGSPPSRCFTTSVVFFRPPTLLTPATYFPSHLTRNLKFLYGSKRCGFALNWAMLISLRCGLSSHLLDLDDDKLGGLQGRKANQDVDDPVVLIGWCSGLAVALHEVSLLRRRSLERALPEKCLHEGSDVETDLRPQRRIVGFEHNPFGAAIKALFDEQRQAADRDVLPLRADR